MKHSRLCNIPRLPPLGTTAEQDDQFLPILREIDPVTRTPVDDVLADALALPSKM
jgi:hypothetical protein